MIPVYKPYLSSSILRHAHEALDSGWLSNGPYLEKTTEKLKEILNVENLLLVSNGTTANHLLIRAMRKFYPDVDEVLIQDNTYIAAINSWLFDNQNYKINICPPDLKTWNWDNDEFDKWAKNLKSKAFVFAVHNLGNIINIPEFQNKYPNLIFLEDNCEGLFGSYNDKFSGTQSTASSLSFFGNKNITCGEGGAVIFRDSEMLEFARCLHGQGQSEVRFLHSELGYNYRMTNIQAAILYGQLEILPEILEKKEIIFQKYRDYVSERSEILATQEIEPETKHSNWMFGIRLINSKNSYSDTQKFFLDRGIEIRPMFYPLNAQLSLLPYYNFSNSNCQPKINFLNQNSKAEILNETSFILPSYPELTEVEQNYILQTLDKWLLKCQN